jgi:hypothetical protein
VSPSPIDPRRPDLREAAETLEQALTEACATRSAHKADTGELIRVEEMLAVASDAARRAISIRRRARHDAESTPDDGADAAAHDPVAEGSTASHRLFDDRHGATWDVWAVYPEGRQSQVAALPGSFQSGWLVFESSDGEKRRLSPIPDGWQAMAPDELEQLCERASTAPRRTPRGEAPENPPPRPD